MLSVKNLSKKYPGITIENKDKYWHVIIPEKYRVGHEAHFAQVMERYLEYLEKGELPDWEVPNMIAKYFTTTHALERTKEAK